MKNWILAARPKTLFASLAPVILGLVIAYTLRRSLDQTVAILTIICALLLQVASNFANDYLDAARGIDNEARLGPTRVTSAGLISHTHMKTALALVLLISLLCGLYLMYVGGVVIWIIGLLSLYFAYGYTGGPFPLSYNGLGEVAAFVFYGVFAVCGTTYLQTHTLDLDTFILSMGPGFISAIILAVNNLRDIKSDTEGKKRTIAVRFGESFQRKLCLALVALSMCIVVWAMINYNFKWFIPTLLLPFLFHKTWLQILHHPIDSKLNMALQRSAQYNLFYCILLSFGLWMSR